MVDPIELRQRAEEFYRSGQFLCSEALLYAFNEELGRPLSDDALKMASGFPVGMGALGSGGCTCGALSAGQMVLGLVYGRAVPGQEAPAILEKAKHLHDWFQSDKGSTCCRVLIRDFEFGSPAHIDQCVRFTGDVTEHVARMLDEDPDWDRWTSAAENV